MSGSSPEPARSFSPTAPETNPASGADGHASRAGVLYGLAAYGSWGLAPIYFKSATRIASAPEVLAHRVVWSVLLLSGLMFAFGQWGAAWTALREPRTRRTLMLSTVLVAANWFAYIYATATNRIVEGSLGYFINPLVNILLGRIFLGESLRPMQKLSVALAAGGGVVMTVGRGVIPSIALFLAGSFAFYGLLRKRVAAGALVGLTVETMLLAPPAAAYLIYLGISGGGSFGSHGRGSDALLALSGLMTSIPLLCFAAAARRLRLATLGFLQYLAPSLQLLVGVALYGEAFTRVHAASFALIWTGLLLYSADALLNFGHRRRSSLT
ncbi:MAG: EamA family transporter RarD [Phycisphaerales bacterium]|nr:EamA family transporter RarD [Phycisphaerales bacterium]